MCEAAERAFKEEQERGVAVGSSLLAFCAGISKIHESVSCHRHSIAITLRNAF